MPSPSVEMMWQEIRLLKGRICDLEEQLNACPPCADEIIEDAWIDYDNVYVIDSDGVAILYQ